MTAVAQLRGGFRTRVAGSGAPVREVVAGAVDLRHTLLLGEPAVSARWYGEAWSPEPERLRVMSADGVVREVSAPAATAWRVRLSGPAGFPLGDFAGAWSHAAEGPTFSGRSAGGVVTPPVPGGGGGAWLPSATLRVEPTVGRWWIEDPAGRTVWSRSSVPTSVETPKDPAAEFWRVLAEGIDRRLAAGPLRMAERPWAVAFEAAEAVASGDASAESAAARVLEAVSP